MNERKLNNYLAWIIAYPIVKSRNGRQVTYTGNSKYLYWSNMLLIKACDEKQAYKETLKLGKQSNYSYYNSDKDKITWKFAGISEMISIPDKLSVYAFQFIFILIFFRISKIHESKVYLQIILNVI